MRYMKMNGIFIVLIACFFFCFRISASIAAEDMESTPAEETTVDLDKEDEPTVYYEKEGKYFLGYRFLSSKDSLKAAEYIYPYSSVTFGLDLLSCPLPYRYHVNAEFLSNYDYYLDTGFAYKDLVLFRDILVGVHHNLDHLPYRYSGEPPGIVYSDRNAADRYYMDFGSNLLSLRFKAPDFPFHTFLMHRHVVRGGNIQQRFLIGDFNSINNVSSSRNIDWKSNSLKIGTNSHLGPVEIEYTYDLDKFNPGSSNILYASYPSSLEFSRPSDIYPHNVIPETESSANSIKIHSSYTGSIVAAGTISNVSQKNNYSMTESNIWKGAFDFSWIPHPVAGVFFKYRHTRVDMDTPDTVTLAGLGNTLNYSVRKGISYDKDVFSLVTRYKPLKRLSLFATYEFSHLQRKDIDAWVVLPSETNIHSINLTAQARPTDNLSVKAAYEYKNYDQPAYNNTPDNSNQLHLTTTFSPSPWVNVYLQYILGMTKRNSLHYLNNDPAVMLEIGARDGRRDQFLASLSTEIAPSLSLAVSWFYLRWDVEQDLAYGKRPTSGVVGLPYMDYGVPYADESNTLSLSFHYIPRKDLTLTAGVTHTWSKGQTGYDDIVGGAPFSLSTFSALRSTSTVLSFDVNKRINKELNVGVRSFFDIYEDKEYGLLDGKVFSLILSAKRYF